MVFFLFKKNLPEFTRNEVSQHNKEDDCWIIVKDKVYNVTNFLDKHPIGKNVILMKGGTDCTYDMSFHSKNANKILSDYLIGYLSN